MFAGIYYGGMYGGSTTSILLNTPGESVLGRSRRSRATRWPRPAGPRRRWPPRPSARSSPAPSAPCCSPSSRRRSSQFAVRLGAPDVLRDHAARLGRRSPRVLGSSLRPRLRRPAPRPLDRPRRHRHRHRPAAADLRRRRSSPTASTSSSSRSASSPSARRSGWRPTCGARPADVIPVGRPWMGRDDWRRSWRPWLRGTAFGFPFGALPAGGAEIPTFLSYITEKQAARSTPRSSARAPSRASPGPEAANNASAAGTLVPLLALGLPTNATAAVMLAAFQGYGIEPGPAADREAAGPGVGADRQPVHRQRRCCWCSTCRCARSGPSCCGSRGRTSTPASCSSPRWGRTPSTSSAFDLFLLLVLGLARVRDAPLRAARPAADHRRHPRAAGRAAGPPVAPASGGDISGLVGGPVAWVCFAIIAIVLLWPLVAKLRGRGRDHDGGPGSGTTAAVPTAAEVTA